MLGLVFGERIKIPRRRREDEAFLRLLVNNLVSNSSSRNVL